MAKCNSRVYVELPCFTCDEPQRMSAESIIEGRRLAAQGCSGAASYECPVQQFVPFGPPELDALEVAFASVTEDDQDPKPQPAPPWF